MKYLFLVCNEKKLKKIEKINNKKIYIIFKLIINVQKYIKKYKNTTG